MAWFDYVNGVCMDICDAISAKLVGDDQSSPAAAVVVGQGGARPADVAFVQIKWSEKPKDDVRKVHEIVCNECRQAQSEYKRLRTVVDQLAREYDQSKDLDFVRRYTALKGMVKRTVMHLRVTNEEGGQMPVSCGKHKAQMRQRQEHIEGLSTQEISSESSDKQEQIKQFRRKISMIRDLIEQMDANYQSSKRFMAFQRYRLMKNMIKTIIYNKWICP